MAPQRAVCRRMQFLCEERLRHWSVAKIPVSPLALLRVSVQA